MTSPNTYGRQRSDTATHGDGTYFQSWLLLFVETCPVPSVFNRFRARNAVRSDTWPPDMFRTFAANVFAETSLALAEAVPASIAAADADNVFHCLLAGRNGVEVGGARASANKGKSQNDGTGLTIAMLSQC